MTSAFPQREPLRPAPSGWIGLQHRYRNANVDLYGSVVFASEDDVDDAHEQEVWLDMAFHLLTVAPMSPRSSLHTADSRVTYVDLPLSQLISNRDRLPGLLVARPDLDDAYSAFLADFVDLFVRAQERDFRFSYVRTPRRIWMQLAVNVIIIDVETETRTSTAPGPPPPPPPFALVPQLEKVAYVEGGVATGVSETACPICLQDFETGEEVGKTPCGHPFHPVCLGRWLEQKPFCPLCRSQVPLRSLAT